MAQTGGLYRILARAEVAEASIALGRDRPREAEALLRDMQRALLKKQMGYDAALVSLDLAIPYAQEGQTAELKRLAA